MSFAKPLLLCALLSAAAFAVQAQTADTTTKKPAASSKAKSGGKLMTRAELRECIAQEDKVAALNKEAVAEQKALDAQKADITSRGEALQQEQAALDKTKPDAVNAYNAKVIERNQLMDDYSAKLPAFNAKVDAITAERKSYTQSCGNRSYDEDMYNSIRKKGK